MMWLELAFAGLGSFIWHWGIGIGMIIILVGAAELTTAIPIIGNWLATVRIHLLWAAAAIALVLAGEYIGARDAAKRCEAKAAIVDTRVGKAVKKAITAPPKTDRWETDE